jgi:hypothetical protein
VIYRPQGEVHDHVQSRAALHTRRGNVLAIVERVNRDHPDAAPCIIALPIADGDNAYMQWVRNQARPHRDLRHEVSIISTTGACPNSPTHPPRRKT